MTKHNPLFVDSTKFHGDLVCTQIELKKVLLHDNESLFVMITNHQDISRRLPMKPLDENTYEAKIHLNHQTQITYRFVIEKDGERVFQSSNIKARAQYAIIEEWEPCFEEPENTVIATETEEAVEAAPLETPESRQPGVSRVRESSMNVRNIIEKWGF